MSFERINRIIVQLISCQGKPQWAPDKEPYFYIAQEGDKFYGYIMTYAHIVLHPTFVQPKHVNLVEQLDKVNQKIPLICFTFQGKTENELLNGAEGIFEMLARQQIQDLEIQIEGLKGALNEQA